MHQWSSYQENIFQAFDQETANLLVNACPGSGKSTTLKEIWNRSHGRTLSLAFNVAIAKHLKDSLIINPGSGVMTLNSLGHRVVLSTLPKAKLVKDKIFHLIQDTLFSTWPKKKAWGNKLALEKVVSLMKCFDPDNVPRVPTLIETYDLDQYPGMNQDAKMIYDLSLEDRNTIDYQDQLLFPVYYHMPMPKYDVVLIDEAQDLNNIQAALLQRIQGARYVFVGDPHQAIYGFRGAMTDGMEVLGEVFACKSLPLKLSYRCPHVIVHEAQKYYPDDIEALPTASEGCIQRLDTSTITPLTGDLILCRNNAPLVALAYDLLRNNIACHVKGRDIGNNLIRYIKRLDPFDIFDASEKIDQDMSLQVSLSQHKPERLQTLEDKWETLRCFLSTCQGRDIQALYMHIENLFDNGKGAMLSTIHKAKGLEAAHVYQLCFGLMPSSYAQTSQAQTQERNLQYVSVTRSQDTLTYLT